jgi:hypothetical protein
MHRLVFAHDLSHDIGLGHDADHTVVLLDKHAADMALVHHSGCVRRGSAGRHRHQFLRHELTHCHHRISSLLNVFHRLVALTMPML